MHISIEIDGWQRRATFRRELQQQLLSEDPSLALVQVLDAVARDARQWLEADAATREDTTDA